MLSLLHASAEFQLKGTPKRLALAIHWREDHEYYTSNVPVDNSTSLLKMTIGIHISTTVMTEL